MNNAATKKLLIVEDDKSLLKVLADRFTDEGFLVFTALTGEEGLRTALKNKPDLILLDIVMPKMDGIEMLRRLRKDDKWGKKANVILLTNLTADDKIMKAVTELEPSYYLIKTEWKLDDIVQRVIKVLNNHNKVA